MKGDFVDMWEGKSEEELFNNYIREVVGVAGTGFYKRRSATRILARRKHQPTGEALTEWLNDPKKGIGKYQKHQWGTATSPPDSWYVEDTKERHIIHLSAESLGLMEYKKARVALETLLSDGRITQYSRETSLGNQEIIQGRVNHLEGLIRWALKRLDNPNTPEMDIEDDMLLYIATARPNFFREEAFKKLATEMILTYGREVAKRYIEALRKVPDICIPAESGENTYFSRCSLIPLVASIGFRYGHNQEEVEKLCQELFNIVKTSSGFERGVSHTTTFMQGHLYDGSNATLNDGVELTVKECVDGISQQR